ncbi:MAG: hypothetical protein U1F77_19840 [Kiritimatiellia bacterium]
MIVELRDRALATSATTRHYRRDAGGRILSHIFDPCAPAGGGGMGERCR